MLRAIFRACLVAASALPLGLGACGGGGVALPADPTATPPSPPLEMGRAFLLESWGAAPEETTVVFPADRERVILIRRGAPDNSLFARLSFPAGSVSPGAGGSARVSVRPRAGYYGIDLTSDGAVGPGAQVTFSYAIHFVAPAGAREAYGSAFRFERFLGVARVEDDSVLVFLDSFRPASDLLTAPLRGTGSYLVAAPREAPRFRSIIW